MTDEKTPDHLRAAGERLSKARTLLEECASTLEQEGGRDAQGSAWALRLLGAVQRSLESGCHAYLSTSCLHGEHVYCSAKRGSNGEVDWVKKPAECKFCDGRCICECHDVAA